MNYRILFFASVMFAMMRVGTGEGLAITGEVATEPPSSNRSVARAELGALKDSRLEAATEMTLVAPPLLSEGWLRFQADSLEPLLRAAHTENLRPLAGRG